MNVKDPLTVGFSDSVDLVSDPTRIDNEHSFVVQRLCNPGQFVANPTAFCPPIEQFAIVLPRSTFVLDLARKSCNQVFCFDRMASASLNEASTKSALPGTHTSRQ